MKILHKTYRKSMNNSYHNNSRREKKDKQEVTHTHLHLPKWVKITGK